MKKSTLGIGIAVLAVVLLFYGCSKIDIEDTTQISVPDQQSFVYTDTAQTFHIKGLPPKDWEAQPPANDQSPFIFTAPKNNGGTFKDNINIIRFAYEFPSEKDMTIDDYVVSATDGMETRKDFKLISQTKRDIAGYPAIVTTFQTTEYNNGTLLQFSQAIFKTEDEAYFITFSATPEGATTNEQVYTAFLDSLVIE